VVKGDKWKPGQVRFGVINGTTGYPPEGTTFEVLKPTVSLRNSWRVRALDVHPDHNIGADFTWYFEEDWPNDLVGDGHG
jgi:hypothetical protein